MAKNLDDNLFEDVPFQAEQDDLFEDVPFGSEPEKMGQLEAAARGAAQGLTFDFADELIAAAQAGAGKLQGEGDLKDLYQKYRDIQRKQMEQAAEEYPVTYYGSDIAAGVIPALLTGGATAAAAVGKAGLKAGAKQAAKTGAKMGAATALGASEADLTEGEIAQAALETGVGGVLGGGLGAVTPAAMSTLGKAAKGTAKGTKALLENIPGAEIAKISYKAGKKGIGTSSEALMEEALKVSKKFNDKIRSVLSKSGVERKEAVRLADEAGKKIDAGVPLDKILKEIQEEGAIGLEIKDRNKLFDELSSLKQGFDEQVTFRELEAKQAKQALQENLDYGSQLESTTEIKRPFEDILIKPESEGNVFGLRSKYSAPGPAGKRIEYTKTLLKSIPDPKVKRIVYDIENASPSKVQGILNYLNRTKVGDLSKPPVGHEAVYRKVAVELRSLLDEAVGEFADPTKAMAKTYQGAERLGIQQAGRGAEAAINDNIDDMAKKLLSSGTPSEIDKKRAFQYFKEASPEYADVVDEAEFISKLNSSLRGGMTAEGVQTTSLRGLAGSAIGGLAKVSNVAGRVSVPVSKKIAPITQRVSKVANKVGEFTDDQLIGASERLLSSENSGLQAMGRQLQFALQQGEPIKNASIWSLSQQPAFRKTIQKAIGLQEEGMADYFGFKPTEFSKTLFPTENKREPQSLEEPMMSVEEPSEENSQINRNPAASEFLKEKEGTRNIGYVPKGSPKSGVTIATGLDLANFDINELNISDELKNLLKPYIGLKGDEARKVAKNLVLNDAQVTELDTAMQEYNDNKMPSLLKDVPEDLITDKFEEAIDSMFTNSQQAARQLLKRVKEGKIDEAIDKGVEWNKTGGKFASGLLQRRMEELYKMFPDKADLIQSEGKIEYDKYKDQTNRSWEDINTIKNIQKNIERESVQLGSNATPGTNRATLEDLMNSLNALRNGQNEAMVAEMEDYAMAGDMNGLQELLDRFKSSSMA